MSAAFRVFAIVVAVVLAAVAATAQPTPTPVDAELARVAERLSVGDTIIVTTDTGMQIRGRFLSSAKSQFKR